MLQILSHFVALEVVSFLCWRSWAHYGMVGILRNWWGRGGNPAGSRVACNCERMNVINYIFNKEESQKGRRQSCSWAPSLEVVGDSLSLMCHFRRARCWVWRRGKLGSTLPPTILDSSQAPPVLWDHAGFSDFLFQVHLLFAARILPRNVDKRW